MRRRLLQALLPAVLSFAAVAADKPTPQAREASAAGFRYVVFETANAKPDEALAMIVGLHYSSARPEAMLEYFDSIDFPARIVLPQGEYTRREGYSWFPGDYADLTQAQQDAVVSATGEKLAAFVERVGTRHPSRGKPVVMGISYGGDLSFLLAIRHPQLFSASFPIASRFLPSWMPAANTCEPNCSPIRAMHGDADTTVPIGPTRDAVAQLKKMDYDVSMTPYAGVAHDFDAQMQRDFAGQAKKILEDH